MLRRIFLTACALCTIVGMVHADVSQAKMLENLDILKNSFETYYAPAQWKKQHVQWTLDAVLAEVREDLKQDAPASVKDYQKLLKKLFLSTQDHHVGISFYSTEEAFLPLRIHGVQDRYFIAWVYAAAFADLKNPPQIGDEVVLFNGTPVAEVVRGLCLTDFGSSETPTNLSLAAGALTMRLGEEGSDVPTGLTSFTVRSAGTTKTATYQLHWAYSPERIADPDHLWVKEPLHDDWHHCLAKEMIYSRYASRRSAGYRYLKNAENEDAFIGSKKSFLPDLGDKIWCANPKSAFAAYIYRSQEGKKVGVVRIPHYMGSSRAADEFAALINLFEKETDALIIDQTYNPGGNVFYMYALASMLSPYPLHVPQHEMAITQDEVYAAVKGFETLSQVRTDQDARQAISSSLWGYPVDVCLARQILNYFQFVVNEWESGKLLTDPYPLLGVNQLTPHPRACYSKPLIVLINHLDFSCADFFPAILQDNGRASIVGSCTAGAGGCVFTRSYPNIFGIKKYSFTASIAKRCDGMPIENLGVAPDITVEFTPDDLEFGYQDYAESIRACVRAACFDRP